MGGVEIKICGSLVEKIIVCGEEFQKQQKTRSRQWFISETAHDVKSYPLSGLRFNALLIALSN